MTNSRNTLFGFPYSTYLLALLALFVVWPLLGAVALYQQYHRSQSADTTLIETWLNESHIQFSPGAMRLQLLPQPQIHFTDGALYLADQPEPIQVTKATLSAHWYSAWLFHWRPHSLRIDQATWLKAVSLPAPGNWQSMRDNGAPVRADNAWKMTSHLILNNPLPPNLNSLAIRQLNVTAYDPATEHVVDLVISATLQGGQGGYELQSQADLSGDGWVERGYWYLNGRWTPSDNNTELLVQYLDSQLEFTASAHDYGLYQWHIEADNLRANRANRTVTADYLMLGEGQQDGNINAADQEAGFRLGLQYLQWTADDPLWRAQQIQVATAHRPHDPAIADIRWVTEAEHWRTSGTEQVGRTQVTWEVNLNDDTLEQVHLHMAQGGGFAPSLTQWQADHAEITLSVRSRQQHQVLNGWAAVNSQPAERRLSMTDVELTELRDVNDILWLYGNANFQADTLTLTDISGTLQSQPTQRSDTWAAWIDCYDAWSPLLTAIITHCTQPGI